MNKISVSVIIVSYRSAQLTIESLRSVSQEREAAEEIDIRAIVVDNASGDAQAIHSAVEENAWSDWVTVLTSPQNGGFAYGNNYGFKYAFNHGPVDYFHLLNPDAQLRSGGLIALVNFLKLNPEAGIAGSSFENEDGSIWPIAFRFPTLCSELESGLQLGIISKILKKWVVAIKMQQKCQPIDWVAGASMMISRKLVEKINGFDEGYFLYFEETDLCLRARRAGFSTWYVPTSKVMHIAGQSTKVTERNAKPKRLPSYWYESRSRYFIKNHGLLYAMLNDVICLTSSSFGVIKRKLQGKNQESVPYFITDILLHSPLLLRGCPTKPFYSALINKD